MMIMMSILLPASFCIAVVIVVFVVGLLVALGWGGYRLGRRGAAFLSGNPRWDQRQF